MSAMFEFLAVGCRFRMDRKFVVVVVSLRLSVLLRCGSSVLERHDRSSEEELALDKLTKSSLLSTV